MCIRDRWHGILIKENHIAAAGGITAVLRNAAALNAGVDIPVSYTHLTLPTSDLV